MTEVGSSGYSEQAFIQVSDMGHYHRHLFPPVEMAEVAMDRHVSPAGCYIGPAAGMPLVSGCAAVQGETGC